MINAHSSMARFEGFAVVIVDFDPNIVIVRFVGPDGQAKYGQGLHAFAPSELQEM